MVLMLGLRLILLRGPRTGASFLHREGPEPSVGGDPPHASS